MKNLLIKSALAVLLLGLCITFPLTSSFAMGYQFDAQFAPYCLNGSFPISVTSKSGTSTGTISLAIGPSGLLTGQLSIGGVEFTVTGKHKATASLTQISLTASAGSDRITFKGTLQGQSFDGTTKGKGAISVGSGTFTLDVSAASPLIAHVNVATVASSKGSVTGQGSVSFCSVQLPVTVKGKSKSTLQLNLKGANFSWSGSGTASGGDYAMSWRGKAFGASVTGSGLAVAQELVTTNQTISALSGGTITLTNGTSVSIPSDVLPADQTITVSQWSSFPSQPPNQSIGTFGPSLATVLQGSPCTNAGSIEYTLSLTNSLQNGLDGAVPVIVFDIGGTNYFLGVPGTVDITNQVATINIPLSLLQPVISQFGAEAQNYVVALVNTSGSQPAQQEAQNALPNTASQTAARRQSSAPASSFGGQFWDTSASQWVLFPTSSAPVGFDPSKRTLVVVHGMLSSVQGAFDCVDDILTAGSYQQAVGFNYNWTQGIETSGTNLAIFLNELQSDGLASADIEAHSEGGPVTLSAASMTALSVNNVVLLGSPIMGTPVANDAPTLVTVLLAGFSTIDPLADLELVPLCTIAHSPFVADLQTSSPVLASIRSSFSSRPQPSRIVLAVAGTHSELPDWLNTLVFGSTPNDTVVPVPSAEGQESGLPSLSAVSVDLWHIQLVCSPNVIQSVGPFVNQRPAANTLFASAVTSNSVTLNGSVNPNGLATTVYFQWGTTTAYGNHTLPQSIGSGASSSDVTFTLTALSLDTAYHYQLVASNSAGYTNGVDMAFTTTSVSSGSEASVTILYSFTGLADGYAPEAALVQGSDGNFYGTTSEGATYYSGTVFKISPGGSFTTLYTFDSPDGANPEAALVRGSDGNFYGTTTQGGSGDCEGGCSTVFKISPTGTLTTLYNFTVGTDGDTPYATLVHGSDGNFYGTTSDGGVGGFLNGNGTVFKISPAGTLTTLYSFTGTASCGGLVQGSDGNFYGTTPSGGTSDNGSVFKISPAGLLTTLYSFTGGTDGSLPSAELVQVGDGNFYGTTTQGGANGFGTVFEITSGGSMSIVYSFTTGINGAMLIQGSDGNFYGTTPNGGSSSNCDGGCGTVFRLYVPPS